jgi:ribonuclease PH
MKIDRINQHNIELDRLERTNHQRKIEEDYRKLIEKKNIERIIAERVERNMRLDRDKGRYIDVDV